MKVERLIQQVLENAGRTATIESSRDLSGGCIHRVAEMSLSTGERVVVKVNTANCRGMFEEEAAGLRALAETRTVLVPEPIGVAGDERAAVLVMTALSRASADAEAWARFGRDLAALHQHDAGRCYGFEADNHLGSTPQPNPWCDDWVEFNAEHRLGHQLRLARDHRLLSADEMRSIQSILDRLDRFIPRRPKPALLHGDLWSGNALAVVAQPSEPRAGGDSVTQADDRSETIAPTRRAEGSGTRHGSESRVAIAVIDPACYIGDGWADIAMMRLFGGFPAGCFRAYEGGVSDHEQIDTRIAVYQLYHVLNHVNLFGRGYAGQAMALARQLGG